MKSRRPAARQASLWLTIVILASVGLVAIVYQAWAHAARQDAAGQPEPAASPASIHQMDGTAAGPQDGASPRAAAVAPGAIPPLLEPVPSWALGQTEATGLYASWTAYAATQGTDDGPVIELLAYLKTRGELGQQTLETAAFLGNWQVVGASVAHDVAAPERRMVLLNGCATASPECKFALLLLNDHPQQFDALWTRVAKDLDVCGVPRSVNAMKAATAYGPSTPWCGDPG
jgi:hypothetical protein